MLTTTPIAACVETSFMACTRDPMVALCVGSFDQVILLPEEQVRPTTFSVCLEVLFIKRAISWEKLVFLQVKLLDLGNIR